MGTSRHSPDSMYSQIYKDLNTSYWPLPNARVPSLRKIMLGSTQDEWCLEMTAGVRLGNPFAITVSATGVRIPQVGTSRHSQIPETSCTAKA